MLLHKLQSAKFIIADREGDFYIDTSTFEIYMKPHSKSNATKGNNNIFFFFIAFTGIVSLIQYFFKNINATIETFLLIGIGLITVLSCFLWIYFAERSWIKRKTENQTYNRIIYKKFVNHISRKVKNGYTIFTLTVYLSAISTGIFFYLSLNNPQTITISFYIISTMVWASTLYRFFKYNQLYYIIRKIQEENK
ncbi:hypothetical protein ACFO26_10155 [Lactococcus nasutitermitis]|uniref:Tandem five-TM protein n=1 Tax=Lactococcus nasutitermitis TaxID=1652957 RepID=A0ABV9JEY0_9LACT|nr:hypothetical protein [Lactococcus nasutitermitis]